MQVLLCVLPDLFKVTIDGAVVLATVRRKCHMLSVSIFSLK